MNNLRQLAAARDQFQLENGRPPASIEELVGETKYIKKLVSVDGESYAGISLIPGQPMIATTAEGVAVTYVPSAPSAPRREQTPAEVQAAALVEQLKQKIKPVLTKALEAYGAVNNGASPTNPEALLPFFATPQDGADFVEFIEAQKNAFIAAQKAAGK